MKATATTLAVFLASLGLSSASVPNPGSQWKHTLFLDDFRGKAGAAPNPQKWAMRTGTSYPGGPAQWGTGEVETYTTSPSNVQLSGNGYLYIVPRKSSSGQWTSARIETVSSSFAAPAGGQMRIEASIKMPNPPAADGLGYWPAFWTLGSAFRGAYNNWPAVGELDIMEHVNSLSTINQGLHCGTDPNGPCNEPSGLTVNSACPNSACDGDFHTYTVIVNRSTSPETIEFYIDQQLKNTVSESTVGSSAWSAAVDHGFYLIMNIAMGGAYPNAVAGTTTPTSATEPGYTMTADYVAVWTT